MSILGVPPGTDLMRHLLPEPGEALGLTLLLPTERLGRMVKKSLGARDRHTILPHILSYTRVPDLLPSTLHRTLRPVISPLEATLTLKTWLGAEKQDPPLEMAQMLYETFEQLIADEVAPKDLKTLDIAEGPLHQLQKIAELGDLYQSWLAHLESHQKDTPRLQEKQVIQLILNLWDQSPPRLWAVFDPRHSRSMARLFDRIAELENGRLIIPNFTQTPAAVTDAAFEAQGFLKRFKRSIQVLEKPLPPTISLMESQTPYQEAMTIATHMREAAEDPKASIAFVTSDPLLTAHVTDLLQRFDMEVDASAGIPFLETVTGSFITLSAAWMKDPHNLQACLSFLKHPWVQGPYRRSEVLRWTRSFERAYLSAHSAQVWYLWAKAHHSDFDQLLGCFETSFQGSDFQSYLEVHLGYMRQARGEHALFPIRAERLVWEAFYQEVAQAPKTPLKNMGEYLTLLQGFLKNYTVRNPRTKAGARVQVLGRLEARHLNADLVIVGGLNEGTWPNLPPPNPWLSPRLMDQLGINTPFASVGYQQYDLESLYSATNLVLSSSRQKGGQNQTPSRFLTSIRLTHDSLKTREDTWRHVFLGVNPGHLRVNPPLPRPPVAIRPRHFAVTQIPTLLINPYAIYAQKILGLDPLPSWADERMAIRYGLMMHDILHNWHPLIGSNTKETVMATAQQVVEERLPLYFDKPFDQHIYGIQAMKALDWVAHIEQHNTDNRIQTFYEYNIQLALEIAQKPYQLRAIVDRIDVDPAGGIHIIDYKTGTPPTREQVRLGEASQLPLEAFILKHQSAFRDNPIQSLSYWMVGGRSIAGSIKLISTDPASLIEATGDGVFTLLSRFEDPSYPYAVRPFGHASPLTPFDHLARYKEFHP